MISILYIGNDLAKKTKYNSMMATLSGLLTEEGFTSYIISKKSKLKDGLLNSEWVDSNKQ